jgi:hypothetical protein
MEESMIMYHAANEDIYNTLIKGYGLVPQPLEERYGVDKGIFVGTIEAVEQFMTIDSSGSSEMYSEDGIGSPPPYKWVVLEVSLPDNVMIWKDVDFPSGGVAGYITEPVPASRLRIISRYVYNDDESGLVKIS